MRIVLHIIILLIIPGFLLGQHCHTDEVHQSRLAQHPELRVSYSSMDSLAQAFDDHEISAPAHRSILEIPVVVHVLWRTEEQNISDAQVKSQIHALNRDFNMDTNDWASNPDPFIWLAERSGLRFRLANIDPDGNPTTGIVRTQVFEEDMGMTENYYRDSRGGSTAWPRPHYLNIWVGETSDSVLGYAIYPNVPIGERDGIVMNYRVFGTMGTAVNPYRDGRTCVHEVGHYFGLRHPWSNDSDCSTDDYIDDTPPQLGPNFVCGQFPQISCDNGPNGDLYMNYMDYGADGCINMFTRRQVEYMWLVLFSVRKTLFHSSGLTGVDDPALNATFSIYPNPTKSFVTLEASSTGVAQLFAMDGRLLQSWSVIRGQNDISLNGISPGYYVVKLGDASKQLLIAR